MIKNKKDPKKVAAGRKGGQASGGNFKRNKKAASIAAQRRQWLKASGKLADYPLSLLDDKGKEIPFPDDPVIRRKS
mgnify:FL=1